MGIMISSDISKQYLLEEDAVEGFRTAVTNGQVRLALQIMTEIVDGIMEIFNVAFSEDDENLNDDLAAEDKSDKEKEQAPQAAVEQDVKQEEAKELKKTTQKKATEAQLAE